MNTHALQVVLARAFIRYSGMFIGVTAALTFSLSATALASMDGPAELPRVHVSSWMASTPAPGAKTKVLAGANLQHALNNARCGDTLLLQAGATFTGNYNLPAKACEIGRASCRERV